DYVEKIHSSAKTLLRILNDILDFSKIEAGRLELEHVVYRMDDVLETVITLLSARIYEKGLELLCSRGNGVPVHVRGDPLRLQQILLNLCGNAVKFTAQGEVELRVEVAGHQDQQVELRFSVRDTGIGIKPEQIETLFDSFTQADTSTTRQYGGTGLGLAISRRLVELMGGSIAATSQLGQGSQFTFTVKAESIREESAEWQPFPELRGLQVGLLVDNLRSREILEELLTSLTFRICREQTRAEGTGGWSERPDLLLFDLCLAERHGLQWLVEQRCKSTWSHVPALILCPQPELVKMQETTSSLTRVRTLPKPVTASQLFDAVAGLFGVRTSAKKQSTGREGNWMATFRGLTGKRVLLTEDNPVNQQMAVDLLELVGLEVEVASNGAEALERLRNRRYEVILMDVQMPVMDGYEATRRIRQELGMTLPIIAMTANAMQGDREKSLLAGMNDHVAKPIDPQHLFTTLHRWMESTQEGVAEGDEVAEVTAVAAEEPLPTHLPGVNLEEAMHRCANNPALLWRLLRRFAVDQVDVTQRLRESWARDEREEAVRLAHTLKGLAGSIGAGELQEAARTLEQGLMNASGEVSSQLDRVEHMLQPLLQALVQLPIQTDVNSTPVLQEPVGMEEMLLLLQPLQQPLRARQAKICQGLVERLEEVTVPVAIAERVTNLIRLVRKYRLKEAELEWQELMRKFAPYSS
ncbi:MAG: response regulator, partial [Magnetococcales bacterium]|nr:response regulator [Magnetococcales bacterium]